MGKSNGIRGSAGRRAPPRDAGVMDAILCARAAGMRIGQPVCLGVVRGVVLGYNIARGGRFPGSVFPLLVATGLGAVKCRLEEVRIA